MDGPFKMPPETAPQDRVWMAFPREGQTLGQSLTQREDGYAAWSAVAHAVADFAPVSMICDPTETRRARKMLGHGIDIIEHPLTEFWMRDTGPTFVHDAQGRLAAVDWIFNGWGAQDWSGGTRDDALAAFVAGLADAPRVSSLLVNEGGAIHVDGEGTVLLTETVQLDPDRNPAATKARIEAELSRTLGAHKSIWLPRGLWRDYQPFGTRGHVDIVATFPCPGTILLHNQTDPAHPDFEICKTLRGVLQSARDATGRALQIIDLPAPSILSDAEGFVDYSYVNHLVCNDGVVACGFGDDDADTRAADILAEAYPGRKVVTIDARALFARGGGIHCITQQQPRAPGPEKRQ